jgi:hypothetical protein
MGVGEGGIQSTNQLRMGLDDLEDVASSERLSPQASLDIRENLYVGATVLVQSRYQRGIVGA